MQLWASTHSYLRSPLSWLMCRAWHVIVGFRPQLSAAAALTANVLVVVFFDDPLLAFCLVLQFALVHGVFH